MFENKAVITTEASATVLRRVAPLEYLILGRIIMHTASVDFMLHRYSMLK